MIKTGEDVEAKDLVIETTAGEALSARDACYISTADGKAYKCDANDTAKLGFKGIAQEAAVLNAAVNIVPPGCVVNGFSALTRGTYYLSDTAGAIQTTPGTYSVQVGFAISATALLVNPGKIRAAGTGTVGSSSGSNPITCGFRPSIIRIIARCARNSTGAGINGALTFTRLNETDYVLSVHETNGTSIVDNNPRLYHSPSDYMTFSITSITATGFTITWVQTGTFAPDHEGYFWEAEGDL
jgi:hypothetical protein